jgi:hypothetical protein
MGESGGSWEVTCSVTGVQIVQRKSGEMGLVRWVELGHRGPGRPRWFLGFVLRALGSYSHGKVLKKAGLVSVLVDPSADIRGPGWRVGDTAQRPKRQLEEDEKEREGLVWDLGKREGTQEVWKLFRLVEGGSAQDSPVTRRVVIQL